MTGRLVLGGLLVLLQLSPGTVQPRPGYSPRLTASQFVAQLERLAAAIETSDASVATHLLRSVPASHEVLAPGGETYEVRLDWLRAAAPGANVDPGVWTARRGDLVLRLRAMAREAEALAPAPRGDTNARDVLTSVLAQKRFARARAISWEAELQRRVRQWLTDLWAKTLGRAAGQQTVARVVAWMASLAAIVILVVWLARLSKRRRDDQPTSVGPLHGHRAPGHVLGLEAAALIRAGQIRDGARVAYRAGVHRLEEEGALRVDEARTPREYVRMLPRVHRRHATLSALTTTFERIWYGSRAAAPDEGDRILALLQDLGCLHADRAK
jgi:hypothetical protein